MTTRIDSEELRRLLDEATPGPWKAGGTPIIHRVTHKAEILAQCFHVLGDIRDTQVEANARLIASAPDLAREVLRLRDTMELMHRGWSNLIELGLAPRQGRETAEFLRDAAQEALSGDPE